MGKRVLYIGIHGLAGSGKDTVAKMLYSILNCNNFIDKKVALKYYKDVFENNDDPLITSATYRSNLNTKHAIGVDNRCICIAFADSCKQICSEIFGIPLSRFYYDKENAWVCINNGFKFTENRPYYGITTADEFYNYRERMLASGSEIWMSLRELLVYVGTYVLQEAFGRNIFVNNVEKSVRKSMSNIDYLNYAIFTDVRFPHEVEYIKDHNGVIINIIRKSANAKRLNNIAEHSLDDEEGYDFTVENNGTMEDLFNSVWEMVVKNWIFYNITLQLQSHDGSNNYLRKIYDKNTKQKWMLCTQYGATRVAHDGGKIVMVDPSGGPMIDVGSELIHDYIVSSIVINEDNKWILNMEYKNKEE